MVVDPNLEPIGHSTRLLSGVALGVELVTHVESMFSERDGTGRVPSLVGEDGSLSFPSEVIFDPTASGKAFVCNLSTGDADAASVLRTHP